MTKSQKTILERINKDYAYRPCPNGADPDQHADREHVRSVIGTAAADLVRILRESRELNHALNRLDEAVMWCHASIDRHGVPNPGEGA